LNLIRFESGLRTEIAFGAAMAEKFVMHFAAVLTHATQVANAEKPRIIQRFPPGLSEFFRSWGLRPGAEGHPSKCGFVFLGPNDDPDFQGGSGLKRSATGKTLNEIDVVMDVLRLGHDPETYGMG